ncbi:hypothetical protein HKBW3S42_01015 [Candidatus Hakubella thermalkaliphila]|uniref:Uncharacterized protein n=1 Tax=Candidatus Hakubella thermalkaliphila TaxID=2754717 RepID=A0A6V8PJA2_9ACTN|nr:hypothetical protein HKBW3S42_01015 [Candidatus Hakubella thermalkaliphila]
MFYHDFFDFALTGSIYNLEELAAVVIQSRSNFGTIKNDTIATLATDFS